MDDNVVEIDIEDIRKNGPSSYAENYALAEDMGWTIYQGVTSPRHQAGKSAFVLRAMETVEEEVHGTHADIDNFAFSNSQLMERYAIVAKGKLLGEDEAQRSTNASNRKWSSQGNQDLVEFLMQEAHSHNGCLFATPHNGFVDNHLVDIWTSMVVVGELRKGWARLYSMQRKMLDRAIKNETPFISEFAYKMPSASLWHEYMRRKIAYNAEREKILRANTVQSEKETSKPRKVSKEEAAEIVLKNPDKFKGPRGIVSGPMIEARLGCSTNAANYAVARYRDQMELEKAEKND